MAFVDRPAGTWRFTGRSAESFRASCTVLVRIWAVPFGIGRTALQEVVSWAGSDRLLLDGFQYAIRDHRGHTLHELQEQGAVVGDEK